MLPPKIPYNETNRQNALESYNILDSLEEGEYDEIVNLAAQISGKKIALISFVDNDRQWIKAKVGLEADQTNRSISFCGHAINTPDVPFIINDTQNDERFIDNPLVTGDPNIRFYAGFPLKDEQGFGLGTLCVIDDNEGSLSEEQISGLNTLSKNVVHLLTLRRNTHLLERKMHEDSEYFAELKVEANFAKGNPNPVLRLNADLSIDKHNDATREFFLNDFGCRNSAFTDEDFLNSLQKFLKSEEQHCFLEFSRNGRDYEMSAVKIDNGQFINIYANDASRWVRASQIEANFAKANPNPVLRLNADLSIDKHNDATREFFLNDFCCKNSAFTDEEFLYSLHQFAQGDEQRCFLEFSRNGRDYEMSAVKIDGGQYINIYANDASRWVRKSQDVQNFFENVFSHFPIDIAIMNEKHEYVFINNSAVRDEKLRSFLIGKTDFDYFKLKNKPDDVAKMRHKHFLKTKEGQKTVYWEEKLPQNNGADKIIRRQFSPIQVGSEAVTYYAGYGIDITELKLIQSELTEQLESMHILSEMGASFVGVDKQNFGKIVRDNLKAISSYFKASRAYFFKYDFTQGKMILQEQFSRSRGIMMNEIPLDILPSWRLNPHLNGEPVFVEDISKIKETVYRKHLESFGIKSSYTFPCMSNNNCVGFVGIHFTQSRQIPTDKELLLLNLFTQILSTANMSVETMNRLEIKNEEITGLNKDLELRIAEKEIMLREIHHRVKNNLQVITSILAIQSSGLQEIEKGPFNEAINRVRSMALIHKKMYQNDTFNFDLNDYLRSLLNDIVGAYNYSWNIELDLNIQIDKIGENEIVPISLIFNELISNSLKHAFKNQDSGKIEISALQDETSRDVTIIYSDNGEWVDSAKPSFGLKLIQIMTGQLKGTFERKNTDGKTIFEFTLKDLSGQ